MPMVLPTDTAVPSTVAASGSSQKMPCGSLWRGGLTPGPFPTRDLEALVALIPAPRGLHDALRVDQDERGRSAHAVGDERAATLVRGHGGREGLGVLLEEGVELGARLVGDGDHRGARFALEGQHLGHRYLA